MQAEADRPSKENSPVPSVTSPVHDQANIPSALQTTESNRFSVLHWAPIQLLISPITHLRGGSPRLVGATSLSEDLETNRTVFYNPDSEVETEGVVQRTDNWIARLFAKQEGEQESIFRDMYRGLIMLFAAPFALAAVIVFTAGTTLVGIGKLLAGLGHVLTAGQYRSRARPAQEIAL